MAVLLTDADGRPLFINPTWETLADRVDEGKLAAATSAQPSGEHVIDEDHILHWETFSQSNAVVPGGRIHMIERSSPGYFNAKAQVIFRAFADQFHLTPGKGNCSADAARLPNLDDHKGVGGKPRNHKKSPL